MFQFKDFIPKFDEHLREKKIFFEGVVIGGAAMQLLGLASRVTKDCDVMFPEIPEEVKLAANEFGNQYNLPANWFNNGPASLIRDLPVGWEKDLVELFNGSNLKLLTLSRLNFLRSKLFAFLDRGIDLQDLKVLRPTLLEIETITGWLKERDANPDWPEYVEIRLKELGKELENDS